MGRCKVGPFLLHCESCLNYPMPRAVKWASPRTQQKDCSGVEKILSTAKTKPITPVGTGNSTNRYSVLGSNVDPTEKSISSTGPQPRQSRRGPTPTQASNPTDVYISNGVQPLSSRRHWWHSTTAPRSFSTQNLRRTKIPNWYISTNVFEP